MSDLTTSERFLLEWLAKEEFSQYGECHGRDLDSLIAKGLAQVRADDPQTGFIAQGVGQMYQAVSLTDAGQTKARELRDG